LKPAWGNSSLDLILKKHNTKRAGGVAQDEGPEFKPQYHKKKKEKRTKNLFAFNMKDSDQTCKEY
jgi:hypothetical protein